MLGYVGHNLALLALPVALAALALAWCRLVDASAAVAVAHGHAHLVARAESGRQCSQALNIWIIQVIVAIGPPLGALVFDIYMKTDWGISLFFLVPLALVAIPALRLPRMALFNIAAIWLVVTLATLGRLALDRRARDGRQTRTTPRPMARARSSPAN